MAKKKSSAKKRVKKGAKLSTAAKKASPKKKPTKKRASKKVAPKKSAAKKKATGKKAVSKRLPIKRVAGKPAKKTKPATKKTPRTKPAELSPENMLNAPAPMPAVESVAPAADLGAMLTPNVSEIMSGNESDELRMAGDDATWLEEG